MTNQDAIKLLQISKDYLPEDKLKEFIGRLEREISINDSLMQSLVVVKSVLEPPIPKWLKPALYILIVLHFILVCGVGLSFILLPFLASWYIALPLMVFIWFFSTSKVECKLTNLENKWRKELGMKQIGGFVGHYFKKPARIAWKKIKARF
ncbi:MAG: DUF2784 family protein [Crenarchaeota archaeon]|nr:MAG: DUF2784 family protein [Thermoproteota archaeon]